MSDKVRQLKKEMIEVYGNECWMNYLVTRRTDWDSGLQPISLLP